MRILGVDCGSRVTGYGLIDLEGSDYAFVDCGAIRTRPRDGLAPRLRSIHQALESVIRKHRPGVAVFETVFHGENAQSALRLGHVRGVSLFTAAQSDLPVFEYSPLQVKSAVTGYGRADKAQVRQMVVSLLGLSRPPKTYDASDALAVAICHAQTDRYRRATAVS
jgi:crossover junction endodeoxyribonuclease RuvC